jgi:hypothetical protein
MGKGPSAEKLILLDPIQFEKNTENNTTPKPSSEEEKKDRVVVNCVDPFRL